MDERIKIIQGDITIQEVDAVVNKEVPLVCFSEDSFLTAEQKPFIWKKR